MIDGAAGVRVQRQAADRPAGPGRSIFPTNFTNDLPTLAQSSIGQNDVQATPLQMALVAAGVANGGMIMTPHVMPEIRDNDGNVVTRYEPSVVAGSRSARRPPPPCARR